MKECCKRWTAKEIEVSFKGWGCLYTYTPPDIKFCPVCGSSLTNYCTCKEPHITGSLYCGNCCERIEWCGCGGKGIKEDPFRDGILRKCMVCGRFIKPIKPKEEWCKCKEPYFYCDTSPRGITCGKCQKSANPLVTRVMIIPKSSPIEPLETLDILGKVLDNTTSVIISKQREIIFTINEIIKRMNKEK